jgi:hypothetical protein
MTRRARSRPSFASLTRQLAAIGRRFYARNWVLGTSGNFSAVVSHQPLRLAITASSAHKGLLTGREFLMIDEQGGPPGRAGRPSAETRLPSRSSGRVRPVPSCTPIRFGARYFQISTPANAV